jgi:hypothetical protein
MSGPRFRLPAWARGTAMKIAAIAMVAVLVSVGLLWASESPSADAQRGYQVPRDGQLEDSTGIRVDRAAVVGDGGLVEIRYTVLDSQKATRFQGDVHHPPVLRSERRKGDVYRAALMKQGHELRPGQTYYILYLNNAGAIRSGETLEVSINGARLQHVPVR